MPRFNIYLLVNNDRIVKDLIYDLEKINELV